MKKNVRPYVPPMDGKGRDDSIAAFTYALPTYKNGMPLEQIMNTLNISDEDLASGEPIQLQMSPEDIPSVGALYKLIGINKIKVTAVLRPNELGGLIVTAEGAE